MFGDQNSLFLDIVLAACSLYGAQKTCVRLEYKRQPKKGLSPQNMNTLVILPSTTATTQTNTLIQ